MTYYDQDGNERSLEWMVRHEPDWAASRMRADRTEIEGLQDRLFRLGEMNNPPCFACGYDGPDYYKPSVHACAARHFATRRKEETK